MCVRYWGKIHCGTSHPPSGSSISTLGLEQSSTWKPCARYCLASYSSSLSGEIFPYSGYAMNFHALLKHVHHTASSHSHQNICHLEEETRPLPASAMGKNLLATGVKCTLQKISLCHFFLPIHLVTISA